MRGETGVWSPQSDASTYRCCANRPYSGFCTSITTRILDDVDELRRRVAERVIALRSARGWSQEELGARAGLTYKFIGEIERGQKSPSLDSLGAIASGFGLDIAELFGGGPLLAPYPRLSGDPLAAVREARDSLDRVLLAAGKPGRRAPRSKKPKKQK